MYHLCCGALGQVFLRSKRWALLFALQTPNDERGDQGERFDDGAGDRDGGGKRAVLNIAEEEYQADACAGGDGARRL